jgi:hypothetical protein
LQQLISDTHFHAERRGERERESMNMAWGTSDPPYLMILQWKLLLLCINFVLVASLHIKEKETMDNYRCIPDAHRHSQISAPTIKISLKLTFYIKNSFRTWLNKKSYSNLSLEKTFNFITRRCYYYYYYYYLVIMMYKMMMKGGLRFFIFCIVGNLFFVIEGSILNVTIRFVIYDIGCRFIK